jgi:hypothetical protein
MSHEYVADFYRPARCVNCGERREHAIHSTGAPHMTTTPEQIEAVARVIAEQLGDDWDDNIHIFCGDDFQMTPVGAKEACRVIARAAINAMRPFIRAEALEEAAKRVAELPMIVGIPGLPYERHRNSFEYARAIRALKETP